MTQFSGIESEWTNFKSTLKIGTIVRGEILAHWQFGVFVSMEGQFIGLIEIPYFREAGQRMTPREYPELGEPIRAVVVGFRDRNHQVELSARPSELAKADKGV